MRPASLLVTTACLVGLLLPSAAWAEAQGVPTATTEQTTTVVALDNAPAGVQGAPQDSDGSAPSIAAEGTACICGCCRRKSCWTRPRS